MSALDKLKLRNLVKERISGMYKDDAAGFANELIALSKEAKQVPSNQKVRRDQDEWTDMAEELFEDRERFRNEIAAQLRLKVNKHLHGTKREATDFVKQKYNEVDAYARKASVNDSSISKVENRMETMDSTDQDFDRQAFNELKKELTERKKLKEDMLTGTLPRFRPYLRL